MWTLINKLAFADFAAAYTAFDPHEACVADLLREYGPDNRPVISYVDYAMSDKADTDAEGRWKNARRAIATAWQILK